VRESTYPSCNGAPREHDRRVGGTALQQAPNQLLPLLEVDRAVS
jgi:hypothetical protein